MFSFISFSWFVALYACTVLLPPVMPILPSCVHFLCGRVFNVPHVATVVHFVFVSSSIKIMIKIHRLAKTNFTMPQFHDKPDRTLKLLEGEDLVVQQQMDEVDLAWEKTFGRSPLRSPSPIYTYRISIGQINLFFYIRYLSTNKFSSIFIA
jgi:hypothetical protein